MLSQAVLVAIIGAVGPIAAAVSAVIVAIIHRPKPVKRSVDKIRPAMLAIQLLCLVVLVVLLFQSRDQNALFREIQFAAILVAALSCVCLLAIQFLDLIWQQARRLTRKPWFFGIVIFLTLLFIAAFAYVCWEYFQWKGYSENERCSIAAFDRYDAGNYRTAIAIADQCIEEFGNKADESEKSLVGTPEPPEGEVPEAVKQTILSRGVLNDVASCYWIKGRSAQKSKDNETARQAYLAASTYRHALTWDRKGYFWSPAKDAADRLKDLK